MTRLVLVEGEGDVECCLEAGFGSQDHWVAFDPFAMAALERKGLTYNLPEDYCGRDELEEHCVAGTARLEDFCATFDQWAWGQYPVFEELEVRPARFDFLPLLQQYHTLIGRALQLRRILESGPAGPAYYVHRNSGAFSGGPIPNDISLNTVVFPYLVSQRDVHPLKYDFSQQNGTGNFTTALRSRLSALVQRSPVAYTLIQDLKSNRSPWANLKAGFRTRAKARNQGAILCEDAYEWRSVIPALRERGWLVLAWPPRWGKVEWSQLGDDGAGPSPEMGDLLSQDGVPIDDLLGGPLAHRWARVARELPGMVERYRALVRRYGIVAALTSSLWDGPKRLSAHLLRRLGVPVLTWQHGYVGSWREEPTQYYALSDATEVDAALIYGPGIESAYQSYASCPVISVGSAQLEAMSSVPQHDIEPRRCRVLYATTNYYQDTWYVGFSPPFSDRLFYKDQLEIVNGLRRMAGQYGAEVTVKLHPNRAYRVPPWVGRFSHEQEFSVYRGSPSFEELLRHTDVVVLDLPSTTLLQALNTDLPVFVLTSHWTYPEEATNLLRGRACLADNVEDLLSVLSRYLDTGEYVPSLQDRGFLGEFGTNRDLESAVDRAVETVEALVRERAMAQSAGRPL